MISFAFTEDQTIARRAAAALAEAHAKPAARAADEVSAFPAALIGRAWALGLVQTAAAGDAPEQPSVLNAIVIEEVAYGDATLAAALAAPLAARCDTFLVTAETDAGARAFIVPASAHGLTVAQPRDSLGPRALQMADVVLHDVFTLRLHEIALTIVRRRHAWAAGLFQSLVLTADLRQCRENVNM